MRSPIDSTATSALMLPERRDRLPANEATDLEVVTFGCRLNAFESEVIRARAAEAGLRGAVIVNTCAVTAEAERQARQAIRKIRRERPGVQLIVTGCAAQLDPARFAAMPEVDRVLGNAEKLGAAAYAAAGPKVRVNDIMAVKDGAAHLVAGFAERVRAFVEIQNGCDHRCTFCIIPFARGPNRSVAPAHVVAQVRRLVAQGYAEVVLTGVDIGDYGRDLAPGTSLAALARAILAEVPSLPRLRLSSIDPAEVDDQLLGLFAREARLMPHVHLSLQAGDPLILKRMKRRHTPADAVGIAARLRAARPGIVLGADLIAGFPSETEAMFERTRAHVDDVGLIHLHVFPYSPRPGTPAARMRQVPAPVRKARAEALRGQAAHRLDAYLRAQVGSVVEALVETPAEARTPHYARVRLAQGRALWPVGAIVRARTIGSDQGALIAEPA
jgi:threonylcarbamoyladenosine tRNA methylthiotransferase MtaB